MRFDSNMHLVDRILRAGLGAVLIYIGFIDGTLIANQLVAMLIGIFGVVNLISSAAGHCPVYRLAGFRTDKRAA